MVPRSIDPERPLHLDTLTMSSGAVLYRAVLSDENMGHVYVPVLANGDYDGIDDVCTP